MKLDFDDNGFLLPYDIVSCDLQTLEQNFVDDFPNSETRRKLFNHYLGYVHEFRSTITRNFRQWINGSFISQKLNPQDIDFVTFLDYKTYENKIDYLDRFWSFSLEDKGLDAYLVAVYPEKHELHYKTQESFLHWTTIYNSKEIETNSYPKGFLELKFT